jgi:hypothetical protein
LTKQDRLARARFWVFHADAQTDQKAALSSLGKAFDELKSPESEREALYAYQKVIWELRYDLSREAGAGKDKARPEADLAAEVAAKLSENGPAWAKWKVPENKAPAHEAVELLIAAHEAKVKAGKAEKPQALEYARRAVRLADATKDLPTEIRAVANATFGWFQFDEGYNAGPGGARQKAWAEARGPIARALELAPQDAKAWRWQFALGVATRFHWDSRAKQAKAKGAELSDAEKLELANDHVRAANLVRTAEYPHAYTAFTAADPAEKAVAKAFYAERAKHYGDCKDVLDAAVKNPALAGGPAAPLWRLTAAEMEFAIPAKPFMSAAQKKRADKLADEAEQSLDKIEDAQLRETAKTVIKRVREYKSE